MASDPRDREPSEAPIALSGRSGSSRAPIVAALGIFVLVLSAIGLAQVFPAPRGTAPPSSSSPPIASSAVASPTVGPAPTHASGLPAARRVRPATLVEDVLAGRLEGTGVYVDGFLRVRCQTDGPEPCVPQALTIDGLGLEVLPGADVRAGLDEPAARGLLALLVRDGALVYLGSFVSDPDGPPRPSDVPGTVTLPAPRGTLVEAAGWLIADQACLRPGDTTATCSPSTPLLADGPPSGGIVRSDGLEVALSPDLSPDSLSTGPSTAGVFLLAPPVDDGGPWVAVARYDPARSVRVVVP